MWRTWLRNWRRYRTPVLAVTATVLLVWSAVVIFGLPAEEMLGFLLVCVIGVALIIALALISGWLLQWFRRRR